LGQTGSPTAHSAKTIELKQTLIELSRNLIKLAMELERAHALLDEYPPIPKTHT
jgi:hypothetical protein